MSRLQFTATQMLLTVTCFAAGLGCLYANTRSAEPRLSTEDVLLAISGVLFFAAAPGVLLGKSFAGALGAAATTMALSVVAAKLIGFRIPWMP